MNCCDIMDTRGENMTTIFFMRHSEPLKFNNINNSDSLQLQNEKLVLTENGENIAKEKSKMKEFIDLDIVFSSNYVRAISTAKYFTKDKINIIEQFGERKFEIDSWDEKPIDFGKKQFQDFNYKLKNGESLNEVITRQKESLNKILKQYKDKKILIVGHATALASLFSIWCEVSLTGPYKFKNKIFFDGKWNFCETFKLTFNDNDELVNIENIK